MDKFYNKKIAFMKEGFKSGNSEQAGDVEKNKQNFLSNLVLLKTVKPDGGKFKHGQLVRSKDYLENLFGYSFEQGLKKDLENYFSLHSRDGNPNDFLLLSRPPKKKLRHF